MTKTLINKYLINKKDKVFLVKERTLSKQIKKSRFDSLSGLFHVTLIVLKI